MNRVRILLCNYLPKMLLLAVAFVALALAFLSYEIGLDLNTTWGPFRRGLFILGIAILVGFAAGTFSDQIKSGTRRLDASVGASAFLRAIGESLPSVPSRLAPGLLGKAPISSASLRTLKTSSRVALFLPLVILIVALYIWFISVGFWDRWPRTTAHYDMLAEAFLSGQTHLLEEPDSRLADLPNPYSDEDRIGIPVVTDASYYEGKYYLYWGPIPAVLIAGAKVLGIDKVGDHVVVFGAALAVLAFSVLIVIRVWSRQTRGLPHWLLAVGIVVVGVAHPLLWVLNRPAIHEAAIISGQAFLLAGLFIAMPAYEDAHYRPFRMLLVGLMWVLAIWTRFSLIGAVTLFLGFLVLIRIRSGLRGRSGQSLALHGSMLFAPFIVGAIIIGAYNQVRFDNPIETGWRYHLGGRGDFSQGFDQAFHIQLLVPNLYNYIGRHIDTLTVFPYIKPIWGRGSLSPLPLALPDNYYAEQVTGVLIVTPFVLFAVYLDKWLICHRPRSSGMQNTANNTDQRLALNPEFKRLAIVFSLGTVFAALPLVFFAIVANRYMLDATQLLAITAVLGSWAFYYYNRHSVRHRWASTFGILATAAFSVLASFLLAVTSFEARFEHLNPELFEQLTRFFAR